MNKSIRTSRNRKAGHPPQTSLMPDKQQTKPSDTACHQHNPTAAQRTTARKGKFNCTQMGNDASTRISSLTTPYAAVLSVLWCLGGSISSFIKDTGIELCRGLMQMRNATADKKETQLSVQRSRITILFYLLHLGGG